MTPVAGPERRGPERPGPDYPPEWDNEPGPSYPGAWADDGDHRPTPVPSSPVALLDQLDELRAKATPGPWEVDEDWIWAGLSGGGAFGELVTRAADLEDADAALIVAAVNAVGPLTAAVRAVLELADELDDDGGLVRGEDAAALIRAALSVTP